jgi:hypothetical protein
MNKLIEFVKLSTWWLPQTSSTHIRESRRFKSIYTLQGKIRFTRHTLFHAWFTYGPEPYISRGPCGQPFASPHKDETCPYTRGSHGNKRQTVPAVILGHLIPPPSRQPWIRGDRFWPSGDTATSAYWTHNTSMRSIRSILARGGQPIGP